MNQHERALQGKLFDAHSNELMQLKHHAHQLCQQYNRLDEWDPQRQDILHQLLGSHGTDTTLQGPIQFNYGCHTHLGHHVFANFNLTVLDDGPIHIGDHVMIGPNVSLMASSHPLLAREREQTTYDDGHTSMAEFAPPITIGSHVWIACGVIITGGVTIGDGAVIGAGSVVTHDIPAHTLACGTPCKVIRPITDADSCKNLL